MADLKINENQNNVKLYFSVIELSIKKYQKNSSFTYTIIIKTAFFKGKFEM
ncbi:MAG: hypothetical protein LBD41_07060 [Clostridiales Family XIII bacterium]|jgi:hypothetical protein|nr:hypothetical protein [Clostridiales Family XIII bacterium]